MTRTLTMSADPRISTLYFKSKGNISALEVTGSVMFLSLFHFLGPLSALLLWPFCLGGEDVSTPSSTKNKDEVEKDIDALLEEQGIKVIGLAGIKKYKHENTELILQSYRLSDKKLVLTFQALK